jgi:hypothetical protein
VLTINNYGCFQDSDEFEGQTKGKQKGKRRANEIDDLGRTKGQTQNDSYDIDNQSNMSKSESEKGKQKGKQVSNNVDDLGQTKGQQLKNIKNKEINIPTLKEFQEYAISKKPNVDIDHIKLKYDAWTENDWMDGNNKKIINWKTTLLNTLPYLKETQTKPINNPFTAPITF